MIFLLPGHCQINQNSMYMMLRRYLFLTVFVFAVSAGSVLAATVDPATTPAKTTSQPLARAGDPEQRIREIESMDLSSLSRAERKSLRKELRSMKKEARRSGGGIYLSTGAIIIILLVILFVL